MMAYCIESFLFKNIIKPNKPQNLNFLDWIDCHRSQCLGVRCSGTQGSTTLSIVAKGCITPATLESFKTTTQALLTAHTHAADMTCVAGAPSSTVVSGALLIVSSFVALVVAAV